MLKDGLKTLKKRLKKKHTRVEGIELRYNNRYDRRKDIWTYVQRIYVGVGLIIFTLSFGILGFMSIEGYTLNEAFYMTIITLSTVGYEEVRPLTESGRLFASLLIVTNISMFAYAISVLSTFLIEGDLKKMIQDFQIHKKIDQLKKHVIVCGFGRYGSEVCAQFQKQRIPFVVIESKPEIVKRLRANGNILFLEGDATSDNILEEAGIQRARGLISTLPDDADNAYIVLNARALSGRIRIISRAERGKSERTLRLAGANEVITPERVGGFYMATLVGQPDVVEFFRIMTDRTEGASISFEELDFEVIPKQFTHKTIRELNIRKHTGANLIAIKMPDGKYVMNPDADTILQPRMRLIVLGDESQIDQFKQFWKKYANDGVHLIDYESEND